MLWSVGSGVADATPINMEIILDASGSMNEKLGGSPKIEIAREVLLRLIRELPPDTRVALRVFGLRGGCEDIQLLVPLQDLNTAVLEREIGALKAVGATPISKALGQARDDFRGREGEENVVVLVSDGKESCRGDPCSAAAELRHVGIRTKVHVIGFDVSERERAQLTCIAEQGGGRYHNATTAGELLLAVRRLVRKDWMEALMDVTTLVATFGLLAFMIERLTNGIAVVLGYWGWWRARMEVSALADPDSRAQIERNRRVALFALSALLAIIGALVANVNLIAAAGLRAVPEIAGLILSGFLIAAGADPLRELLKPRERDRAPQPSPIQLTGTLIVQQVPPPAGRGGVESHSV